VKPSRARHITGDFDLGDSVIPVQKGQGKSKATPMQEHRAACAKLRATHSQSGGLSDVWAKVRAISPEGDQSENPAEDDDLSELISHITRCLEHQTAVLTGVRTSTSNRWEAAGSRFLKLCDVTDSLCKFIESWCNAAHLYRGLASSQPNLELNENDLDAPKLPPVECLRDWQRRLTTCHRQLTKRLTDSNATLVPHLRKARFALNRLAGLPERQAKRQMKVRQRRNTAESASAPECDAT
jgi:hypothetical protein